MKRIGLVPVVFGIGMATGMVWAFRSVSRLYGLASSAEELIQEVVQAGSEFDGTLNPLRGGLDTQLNKWLKDAYRLARIGEPH